MKGAVMLHEYVWGTYLYKSELPQTCQMDILLNLYVFVFAYCISGAQLVGPKILENFISNVTDHIRALIILEKIECNICRGFLVQNMKNNLSIETYIVRFPGHTPVLYGQHPG